VFPLRVAIHAVAFRTKGDSVLTHKLWLDDPGSTFTVFVTGKPVVATQATGNKRNFTWNSPPVHSPIRPQKGIKQSTNKTTLIIFIVSLSRECHHLQSSSPSWGDQDAVLPRISKTAMKNNISDDR